jgi:hypothetical protein
VRAAIYVLVIFVATLPGARAEEPERVLGMALAEAQLGHCAEALAHLDRYLAATKTPSSDAFEVVRRCPRQGQQSTPPTPAPAPHKPRGRLFLVDVEAGVNVPLTSAAREAAFLGVVELGVALSNRIGLDLVLLAESLVSRAPINPDGSLATVFSENIVLGLEERRPVWRRLAIFGTVAAGILVDSYKGFRGAALHFDVGVGWQLGPGELRLRPLDFGVLVETDRTVGASWRATVGYALRF